MGRYTDDFRAINAMRRVQARRDNDEPVDADGFTAADHFEEARRSMDNLNRAISAGVTGSEIFEAKQVIARMQAIVANATMRELLS